MNDITSLGIGGIIFWLVWKDIVKPAVDKMKNGKDPVRAEGNGEKIESISKVVNEHTTKIAVIETKVDNIDKGVDEIKEMIRAKNV